VVTAKNNLVQDASNTCGLINGVNGNIIGSDPNLGGQVSSPGYFPLISGSPALDSGDDTICAAAPVNNTSQNGVTRPQGTHCDIGSFELDNNLPTVVSSLRANPDPTNAATVFFTVTFSEPVSGVDTTDFTLTTSGLSGAFVASVSGSSATRSIGVNTGTGSGTIRLDVTDNDSIIDAASNPLGGTGAGNGNFTSGQTYTIDKTTPTPTSTATRTVTPIRTPTATQTRTTTSTQTGSATRTSTRTATRTQTRTGTPPTSTITLTRTASLTPTPTIVYYHVYLPLAIKEAVTP
jgi:hypothetical protein